MGLRVISALRKPTVLSPAAVSSCLLGAQASEDHSSLTGSGVWGCKPRHIGRKTCHFTDPASSWPQAPNGRGLEACMYILVISLLCLGQQDVQEPGLPLACCVTLDRVHKGGVDSNPRGQITANVQSLGQTRGLKASGSTLEKQADREPLVPLLRNRKVGEVQVGRCYTTHRNCLHLPDNLFYVPQFTLQPGSDLDSGSGEPADGWNRGWGWDWGECAQFLSS